MPLSKIFTIPEARTWHCALEGDPGPGGMAGAGDNPFVGKSVTEGAPELEVTDTTRLARTSRIVRRLSVSLSEPWGKNTRGLKMHTLLLISEHKQK